MLKIKIRYIVKGRTGLGEMETIWDVAVHDSLEQAHWHATAARAATELQASSPNLLPVSFKWPDEVHNEKDLNAHHYGDVQYYVEPLMDVSGKGKVSRLNLYEAAEALYQARCRVAKLYDEPIPQRGAMFPTP